MALDSADFGPEKPKPSKPPDPSQLESDPDRHLANVSLIKVNIEDNRTSDKITYEFNSKNKTHSFIANTGYLFDAAYEGSITLWNCMPGKYADRINVTEHSDDTRSITVFIPLEAQSDHSEVECESPSTVKLPKIYDPHKKNSKRVFMYDTEEEYADMSDQAGKNSDKPKPVAGLDFEIQENKPESKSHLENEVELESETATGTEIQDIQPEPEQESNFQLITLDVKTKESINGVCYEYDENNRTHTFTPLPGFLVGRVVKGQHKMWECENGVYPEKVFIFPNEDGEMILRVQFPTKPRLESDSDFEFVSSSHSGRVVAAPSRAYDPTPRRIPMDRYAPPVPVHKPPETPMYSLDVDQMHSAVDSRAFKRIESTRTRSPPEHRYSDAGLPKYKIPVDLTIDFRWNTFLFDYSKLNNVATYTPKEGYAFGKVKLFSGYYSRGSELVLWTTQTPEKFANKVVVIEHSKIILYLDDATTVVFKKGSNNLWIEDEYSFEGSGLDWDYQYISLDINRKRTTDVYKVSRHYHDSNIVEYVYLPKNGYKFSVVKQGGEKVWAITDQNRYSTRVSVMKFSHFTEVIIGLADGTSLIYVKVSSGNFKRINFGD
ncbi:hypothetical protein MACJ_002643 [Theileria orientalis]|uniref:Uncharacterized protein n=1 Tax=Theileria orientalis TaxID=68886 RepID=A0A976M7Y1_THEOR|nr:hypothetical protein MACJ_002643 [Theileria orientalis]